MVSIIFYIYILAFPPIFLAYLSYFIDSTWPSRYFWIKERIRECKSVSKAENLKNCTNNKIMKQKGLKPVSLPFSKMRTSPISKQATAENQVASSFKGAKVKEESSFRKINNQKIKSEYERTSNPGFLNKKDQSSPYTKGNEIGLTKKTSSNSDSLLKVRKYEVQLFQKIDSNVINSDYFQCSKKIPEKTKAGDYQRSQYLNSHSSNKLLKNVIQKQGFILPGRRQHQRKVESEHQLVQHVKKNGQQSIEEDNANEKCGKVNSWHPFGHKSGLKEKDLGISGVKNKNLLPAKYLPDEKGIDNSLKSNENKSKKQIGFNETRKTINYKTQNNTKGSAENFRKPEIMGLKNKNKNAHSTYNSPKTYQKNKVRSFEKNGKPEDSSYEKKLINQRIVQNAAKTIMAFSPRRNEPLLKYNILSTPQKSLSARAHLPKTANKNKVPHKVILSKITGGTSKVVALILLQKIAEHGLTTIHKCIEAETGMLVCLKKNKVDAKNINLLINQHKISASLEHPNLVKSYCSLYDEENLYLLMEYMPSGTLLQEITPKRDNASKTKPLEGGKLGNSRHTLSTMRNTPISLNTPNQKAKEVLSQILEGLRYLHENSVFHRDIKPENILLSNETYKIGDFGSSCFPGAQESIGTLDYAAPQILLKIPYCQAIDIWSLGCIAFELDVGRPPFFHEDRNETMRKIVNADYDVGQVKDVLLRHLISKMLVKESKNRISAEEALKHSFFQDLRSSSECQEF